MPLDTALLSGNNNCLRYSASLCNTEWRRHAAALPRYLISVINYAEEVVRRLSRLATLGLGSQAWLGIS